MTVAAWRIRAGRVFDGRTCNYDFMPSIRDYLGLDVALDRSPGPYASAVLSANLLSSFLAKALSRIFRVRFVEVVSA